MCFATNFCKSTLLLGGFDRSRNIVSVDISLIGILNSLYKPIYSRLYIIYSRLYIIYSRYKGVPPPPPGGFNDKLFFILFLKRPVFITGLMKLLAVPNKYDSE